jgi:hypothetical protein
MRNTNLILFQNFSAKGRYEDTADDWRILLHIMLKEQDLGVWTGFKPPSIRLNRESV